MWFTSRLWRMATRIIKIGMTLFARARARAAVGIAHLRLVKSVVVEVDKVDHNGNPQTP